MKKVYQVKISDGVWVNCYKDTGENVGYQSYRTKKNAKLGHEAGVNTDCPIGSDGYEGAARQYAV